MFNCTLSPDINTCKFYSPSDNSCSNPNEGCTFREDSSKSSELPTGYVREERWYEKYYKK